MIWRCRHGVLVDGSAWHYPLRCELGVGVNDVVEVTVVVQDRGAEGDGGCGDGDIDDPCCAALAGLPESGPDVDDDLFGVR